MDAAQRTDLTTGPFFLGIDFGTGGCRCGIFDATGEPVHFHDSPWQTSYPGRGMAEQDPRQWWESLVRATRMVVAESGVVPQAIKGIGFGATSATLVSVDEAGEVLRPAMLWMDVRATEQAARADALDHPVRRYNGGGQTPATAEWYPFKAAWLRENEREVYERTRWLLDCPDWLGFKLTGELRVNLCSASLKMYHDNELGGWPTDFYEAVGAGDAFDRLPGQMGIPGTQLGTLLPGVAEELGLVAGTPVGVGIVDAECGMLGLNVLEPGRMALITGSSDVLLGQADAPISGPGFFGGYTDALVQGLYIVEGAQASTGSALRWFRDNFAGEVKPAADALGVSAFDLLNRIAKDIPIGSDGVVINEYFQGNRTPYTDSRARATITGLGLHHTSAHVYHALQEAACYGLEHNLRAMRQAGFSADQLVACGGSLNSRDWMQMHADVTGVAITTTKVQDASCLGAAILGAAASGLVGDMNQAAAAMVHEVDVIEPDPAAHEEYRFWTDAYIDLYPGVREVQHRIADHLARKRVPQQVGGSTEDGGELGAGPAR